ncbi:MAG: hypothetical protein V7782_11610 [Psychromonas sp.]
MRYIRLTIPKQLQAELARRTLYSESQLTDALNPNLNRYTGLNEKMTYLTPGFWMMFVYWYIGILVYWYIGILDSKEQNSQSTTSTLKSELLTKNVINVSNN